MRRRLSVPFLRTAVRFSVRGVCAVYALCRYDRHVAGVAPFSPAVSSRTRSIGSQGDAETGTAGIPTRPHAASGAHRAGSRACSPDTPSTPTAWLPVPVSGVRPSTRRTGLSSQLNAQSPACLVCAPSRRVSRTTCVWANYVAGMPTRSRSFAISSFVENGFPKNATTLAGMSERETK